MYAIFGTRPFAEFTTDLSVEGVEDQIAAVGGSHAAKTGIATDVDEPVRGSAPRDIVEVIEEVRTDG